MVEVIDTLAIVALEQQRLDFHVTLGFANSGKQQGAVVLSLDGHDFHNQFKFFRGTVRGI